MISGSRPVEPRTGSRRASDFEVALLCWVEVGCTMVSGRPLVVPISGRGACAVDKEATVVGSGSGTGSGTGSGEGVGWMMEVGSPLVEPTWGGLCTTVSAGFSGPGVGTDDDAIDSDAGISLEDPTVELDGGGGGGGGGEKVELSEEDAAEELSGTVDESGSNVEVSVFEGSTSLVLTRPSEEEESAEVSELPRKSDSTNEGKSI